MSERDNNERATTGKRGAKAGLTARGRHGEQGREQASHVSGSQPSKANRHGSHCPEPDKRAPAGGQSGARRESKHTSKRPTGQGRDEEGRREEKCRQPRASAHARHPQSVHIASPTTHPTAPNPAPLPAKQAGCSSHA
eukprot:4620757-Alexandrium_andersonii.AAC.1